MFQQEKPYEVGSCVHERTVVNRRRVRLLDRITAVLLSSIGVFVGLFLVLNSRTFGYLYWPWGTVGIPIAVMVVVCFLPKRVNRLWQVWMIALLLTLFGVAIVFVPHWLWAILNMHNAGTITVPFLVGTQLKNRMRCANGGEVCCWRAEGVNPPRKSMSPAKPDSDIQIGLQNSDSESG